MTMQQTATRNETETETETELPKVLIVDDDLRNQFAMNHILEDRGCELFTVGSGLDALELLARHEFAVALLDVQMPGMNGFELSAAMRADAKTKSVPIIFLTAINKEDQHVQRGYEVGAVDYLFKPINTTILQSKVEVFLDLYRQKKELDVMGDLKSAKDDLEQFAAIAGDNLATLLRGVTENTEALERECGGAISSAASAHLRSARGGAQAMQRLLDGLVGYLQIGSGLAPCTSVNLQKIVQDVVKEGAQRSWLGDCEEQQAEIVIASLPTIWGHPVGLSQLFQNLISNAVKLTSRVVKIKSAEVEGEWQILVWANGDTIDRVYHEAAFKVARPEGDGGRCPGDGFELAACKKIAAIHQSKLWLESPPGQGVSFRMTFPKLRSSQMTVARVDSQPLGSGLRA